jgi:hypothetical protein
MEEAAMDERLLKHISSYWVLLQPDTAEDQFLAINKTSGMLWSFNTRTPAAEDWYKWLVLPRNAEGSEFWIFNKAAQGGSGELLTCRGDGLGQWGFHDGEDQIWELRLREDHGLLPKVTLISKQNREALQTWWDARQGLRAYNPIVKEQKLRVGTGGELTVPVSPAIDGEPGQIDRELLTINGFDGPATASTPWRTVGWQLIPFPFVEDGWSIGEQMNLSPYYLMVRDCRWELADDQEYPGSGSTEREFTWEIGVTTKKFTSYEATMKIEVGAQGRYKTKGGVKLKFSASFSHGQTWTQSNEIERYEKETGRTTCTYPEGKRTRVVVWKLVNRYRLLRHTETPEPDTISHLEFTEKAPIIGRSYPPENLVEFRH